MRGKTFGLGRLWAGSIPVILRVRPMTLAYLLRQTLWLVPLILQTSIAGVMLRRKLVSTFPLFFAYTAVVVSRDLILLFIRYSTNPYSLIYWTGEGLAVILSVGAILEILKDLVPPFRCSQQLLTFVRTCVLLSILAALFILTVSDARSAVDRLLESIILMERAARFFQVSVLLIIAALMSRLGLASSRYSLGIIAGFGIYSAVDLLALEFRGHLQFLSHAAFVFVRPAAYNFGAFIWAACFFRSSSAPEVEAPSTSLVEWNEAVADYVNQWYRRY